MDQAYSESKNTEAIIEDVNNVMHGMDHDQHEANADDLFFPTEVETHNLPEKVYS